MTNEVMKEIAAFLRDYKTMCKGGCEKCSMKGTSCGINERFDSFRAIFAVEKWRESRKPKPEVIDKSLDIYTVEVQAVRFTPCVSVKERGQILRELLSANGYTVTDFKAQRFALETHKED